tara:strand:- start:498 stop:998 length:501 start_codon:yes stop_codon:yes gene_type:complete
MKDYKTFLSEQVDLNEKVLSVPAPGVSDKAGSIASMRGSTVRVDNPNSFDFVRNHIIKTTYNFTNFIDGLNQNFGSLSGTMVVNPEQAKAYKETLKRMDDSDPKKAELAYRIDKMLLLPASADRTEKSQQILRELDGIAMDMQPSNVVSSDDFLPKTFYPTKSRTV